MVWHRFVSKLLIMFSPIRPFFGEKDFQQLAIIRQLVKDLKMPVELWDALSCVSRTD